MVVDLVQRLPSEEIGPLLTVDEGVVNVQQVELFLEPETQV